MRRHTINCTVGNSLFRDSKSSNLYAERSSTARCRALILHALRPSCHCCAIMPLASLIGSGMGILNPHNLEIIIDNAKVPIIVDAGVGTASDAVIAMELGCDGVLMNTAIAAADNPILMAAAMKKAIESGREAFLAGRMKKKFYQADPSSPTSGLIK